MKLDSPLFNRIRVKPEQEKKPVGAMPVCQWPGCACEATHRAPKGRLRESQYWRFCLEHVREYNSTYNYFAGMSDEAVARCVANGRAAPARRRIARPRAGCAKASIGASAWSMCARTTA